MNRVSVIIIAIIAAFIPTVIIAEHVPSHMEVTSSTVHVQSATVVHPPLLRLSPIEWRDIPNIESITATGRQFKMAVTCTSFNEDGIGPDYRYAIGITMDDVAVGETRFDQTPSYKYYVTGSAAGSLRENIDPSSPSTHTFKIQAWGIQGRLAIIECNYTIEAYQ